MKKYLLPIILIICLAFTITGFAKWYIPDIHYDPDNAWEDEVLIYDGLDNTAGNSVVSSAKTWSSFILLDVYSTLHCEKVKFLAYSKGATGIEQIDIDLYYNSQWNDLYEGVFDNEVWTELELPSPQYLYSARIRFYAKKADTALLYGFEFWNPSLWDTYDQRIMLTIDNTKIDSDLTWFPVMIKLTSGQMEEVFAEFDSDDDFDRCAITLADESTQIYGDCERFDDSESVAEYHVAKTGVITDADAAGYLYFYYDKDAAHNTTYISKSGYTAAQSVYDANFKAVYHMNDPDYDIVNMCDATTSWAVTGGAQSIDTADKYSGTGSLKLITNAAEGYVAYGLAGTWNWSTKTYLKVWMKGDTAESGELFIIDNDGNWERWAFTYPLTWTLMTFDLSSPTGDDGTGCGDWSDIDYFRFDVNANGKTARFDEISIYPGAITVIDSTSNTNHGTKKGAGEPAEATGKIGQGQDYDGTDDYVNLGDILDMVKTADQTLECLIKTADSGYSTLIQKQDIDSPYYGWGLYIDGSAADRIQWEYYTSADDRLYKEWDTSGKSVEDDAWHYLVTTKDDDTAANLKLYVDAVEEADIDDFDDDLDSDVSTNINLQLGARDGSSWPYEGIMDEVRISDSVRSAAWIKATYNSLWDTLLTYGDEETETEGGIHIFFTLSDF